MQQGALERQALPHAAREAGHPVVRAVRQARLDPAPRATAAGRRQTVETGEEQQVLARGQLRDTETDRARVYRCARGWRRRPRRRSDRRTRRGPSTGEQRRQNGEQRGFAGAVRAKQADDFAALTFEGNLGERLAAAVVPGDVDHGEAVESRLAARRLTPPLPRLRAQGPIESGEHALELGHQLQAPRRRHRSGLAAPLALDRHQLAHQPFAPLRQSARPLRIRDRLASARNTARRRRSATPAPPRHTAASGCAPAGR